MGGKCSDWSCPLLVKKMLAITKGEVIQELVAATTPVLLLISIQKQLQQSAQSSVPVHNGKDKPDPSLFTDHHHRPGLGEDAPTSAVKYIHILHWEEGKQQ